MRQRLHKLPLIRAGRVSLFGVWVASFALLFQTFLPLTYRPAAANPASVDGQLIICTAHGLAQAPETNAPFDTDSNGAAGKTLKCPLCQVWHSLGNALPASANNILGPAYTAEMETGTVAQPLFVRLYVDPLQARAPPLTV